MQMTDNGSCKPNGSYRQWGMTFIITWYNNRKWHNGEREIMGSERQMETRQYTEWGIHVVIIWPYDHCILGQVHCCMVMQLIWITINEKWRMIDSDKQWGTTYNVEMNNGWEGKTIATDGQW